MYQWDNSMWPCKRICRKIIYIVNAQKCEAIQQMVIKIAYKKNILNMSNPYKTHFKQSVITTHNIIGTQLTLHGRNYSLQFQYITENWQLSTVVELNIYYCHVWLTNHKKIYTSLKLSTATTNTTTNHKKNWFIVRTYKLTNANKKNWFIVRT